jgi:PIN domain nuclease of toxin-antitoxin system
MLQAIVDTHAIIWYVFADSRLSNIARMTIEQAATDGHQVGFSSITLAEIIYLSEKGRISPLTLNELLAEVDRPNSVLMEVPFNRQIAQTMQSIDRTQVPDLPDRIIAATALYHNIPLISRDRKIQLSTINTIW